MMAYRNLGDLVERTASLEATALIDLWQAATPRIYSHGALDEGAQAVARGLLARGCKRGDRIAILAVNRAEYVLAYFGIMRAGMIAVPVNWKVPRATIDFIMHDAGVSLVLTDAERRALCPDDVAVIDFDDASSAGFQACLDPGPFATVQPQPADIAMFLYTSGSTGRPKGVPLSHAGQIWSITHRSTPKSLDLTAQRLLVAAPLFHMNALATIKFAMAMHASVVLLPQFRAPAYIDAIARYRCTWLTSVPTMMALVAQEHDILARTDLSSVRQVTMGSAPLTQGLMNKVKRLFPQAMVSNGYGTTEAGPAVFGPHPAGVPRPDLSVGYPLPNIGVRLVDGDNLDADAGVLQMCTPALMPGYHNLPEKTASVMTADGYYISGDIMRRDAEGFYYFVGRADDMFVCNGENVYPGEVEKMLERHPAIQQACVVPVADEVRGQKPVAFIVPEPGVPLTAAMVKEYALANGPAYQHPRHVEFVAALPLAGTNKIDRRALTEQAIALATSA